MILVPTWVFHGDKSLLDTRSDNRKVITRSSSTLRTRICRSQQIDKNVLFRSWRGEPNQRPTLPGPAAELSLLPLGMVNLTTAERRSVLCLLPIQIHPHDRDRLSIPRHLLLLLFLYCLHLQLDPNPLPCPATSSHPSTSHNFNHRQSLHLPVPLALSLPAFWDSPFTLNLPPPGFLRWRHLFLKIMDKFWKIAFEKVNFLLVIFK